MPKEGVMRKIIGICIASVLLTFSLSVNAAKGVVVLYKPGCDYYIVETTMGYALLEWYGGNDPSEGDTLVGDYESYGMKDIYNISADSETKVWVEEFWLSKGSVLELSLIHI